VGQVVGVHGLRGELTVKILTDDPHRFALLERVFIGLEEQEPLPWLVQSYRLHKGRVLLKLQGCDDRSSAEALRGCLVQVPLHEAIPLAEGEYFEHQVLGLDVWTATGEHLGEIVEIIETGANDVYVVRGPERREILIPALDSVILKVDLAAGRLVAALPAGLEVPA